MRSILLIFSGGPDCRWPGARRTGRPAPGPASPRPPMTAPRRTRPALGKSIRDYLLANPEGAGRGPCRELERKAGQARRDSVAQKAIQEKQSELLRDPEQARVAGKSRRRTSRSSSSATISARTAKRAPRGPCNRWWRPDGKGPRWSTRTCRSWAEPSRHRGSGPPLAARARRGKHIAPPQCADGIRPARSIATKIMGDRGLGRPRHGPSCSRDMGRSERWKQIIERKHGARFGARRARATPAFVVGQSVRAGAQVDGRRPEAAHRRPPRKRS